MNLVNMQQNDQTMTSRELHKIVFDATGKFKEIGNFHAKCEKVLKNQWSFILQGAEKLPNGKINNLQLNEVQCNMVMASIDINHLQLVSEVFVKVKNSQPQLTEIELIIQSAKQLQAIQLKQAEQDKRLNEIEERQNRLDGDTKYMTAIAYCRLKNIPAPLKKANGLGKKASAFCKKSNINIGTVPDERWGSVNSYPIEVLDMYV